MRKVYIGIAVLLAGALLACGSSGGDTRGPGTESSGQPTKSNERTVVFTVGGTASSAGNVTYQIGGNQSQDNGVKLPWTKTAKTTENPAIIALSAQNAGTGDITCTVTVDGKQVSTNKSSGEYAVVSCSGSG